MLDALLGRAKLINPIRTRSRPTLDDPKDEMVLECAVQAGAEAIVTMNIRDFVPARSLFRVEAIRPGILLARLAQGDHQMSNYPLRLPEHVMAEAKSLAARSGTSLNQFLASVIAERVGELRALAGIEARAARADPGAALAILRRAPDRPPMEGDKLPAS